MTGLLPFRGGSDYLIFRMSTEARFKTEGVHGLSPEATSLITRCLQVEPEARPTIEELLQDPFFNDLSDTLP